MHGCSRRVYSEICSPRSGQQQITSSTKTCKCSHVLLVACCVQNVHRCLQPSNSRRNRSRNYFENCYGTRDLCVQAFSRVAPCRLQFLRYRPRSTKFLFDTLPSGKSSNLRSNKRATTSRQPWPRGLEESQGVVLGTNLCRHLGVSHGDSNLILALRNRKQLKEGKKRI